MQRPSTRLPFFLTLLIIQSIGFSRDLLAQDTSKNATQHLRVTMDWATLSTVTRKDARLAFRVWIETLGTEMGLDLKVRAKIAESSDEIRQAVVSREADLLVLNALTYLRLQSTCPLEPVVVVKRSDGVGDSYLLLARRSAKKAKKLLALAGDKVRICTGGKGSIPTFWLEERLRVAGLPRGSRHFRSIKEVRKPSSAVLPVFFGQADACVVDSQAFRTITELNPQLGRELVVIDASPRLIDTVVCFRKSYEDPDFRRKLTRRILRVHELTKGQQIMTIFKVERFEAFDPIHIHSLAPLLGTSGAVSHVREP